MPASSKRLGILAISVCLIVAVVAAIALKLVWPHAQVAPKPRVASIEKLAPAPLVPPPATSEPAVNPAEVLSAQAIAAHKAALAAAHGEDLKSVFPAPELPIVATVAGARSSLGYLAKNGADLTKPMPSKHVVFAANADIATSVIAWAKANGFEVQDVEVIPDHVGVPRQRLELVRTEVATPEGIAQEGHLVFNAFRQMPGTYYQTWSGAIVR
jgi:hypothetical protein